MPNTFTLLASSTVGAGGASSIDFTSIPSTYTDLVLEVSLRSSIAAVYGLANLTFNGASTNFSSKYLQGSGSAASSFSGATSYIRADNNAANSTASTFSNGSYYIPNYAGSTNKSVSGDNLYENNATAADMFLIAGLWSSSAAINQITLTPSSGTFVQYSTAYLYGVLKS